VIEHLPAYSRIWVQPPGLWWKKKIALKQNKSKSALLPVVNPDRQIDSTKRLPGDYKHFWVSEGVSRVDWYVRLQVRERLPQMWAAASSRLRGWMAEKVNMRKSQVRLVCACSHAASGRHAVTRLLCHTSASSPKQWSQPTMN
jgi:hypothetical protein